MKVAVLITNLLFCLVSASFPSGKRMQYYLQNADGGYRYGYNTGEGYSASVEANPENEVKGRYSYINNEGQLVGLEYTSGASGFVPSQLSNRKDDQFSSGSSSCGSRCRGSSDGSYSFSYATGDQSRQEVSDGNNNVQGSYQYTSGDDGKVRRVDYYAGAGTGFVAKGDHLPTSSSAFSTGKSQSKFSGGNLGGATLNSPVDASYNFAYDAGDHYRRESSDSDGNVQGSFSFVADDGVRRKVDYKAGRGIGFVASGDHIPKDHRSNQLPIAGQERSQFQTGGGNQFNRNQGNKFSFVVKSDREGAQNRFSSGGVSDGPRPDGSYSFSYATSDQARSESSDSFGNVKGRFSYIDSDDKQERRVEYEAGAGKGFVAEGAHLPPSGRFGKQFQSKNRGSLGMNRNYEGASITYLPPTNIHSYGYIYDSNDQN